MSAIVRPSAQPPARPPAHLARALRLARLVTHFAQAGVVAGAGYPFMKPARQRLCLQRWSQQLLHILATRLTIHGEPPREGERFLLAGNHVSWLDIFAINAAVPTRFVAKSEIRGWPLVGWLCVKADTLFIERTRRRDLARLDDALATALRSGAGVGVFLEGTTTDGNAVLPFHSSLLRPAQQANVSVVPVAIRYRRIDGSICTEAAYDGDKTVLDTLRLMLTQHEIHVHVHFLPPVSGEGVHRKEFARQTREVIVRTLFP